ncbi:MAG: DUF4349 domain-containing protein [Anaerolineales bacterium]|nr:MAG: DUF4349 domain-containing protein [Anaerolineales bacterium]
MKREKWFALITLAMALALVAGCAARAPKVMEVIKEIPVEKVVIEREVAKPAPAALPPAEYAGADEEKARAISAETERMIIRTASMSVVVEDTDQALRELHALAKLHDGYIADSNRWLVDDDTPMANVTLRVPAESLDEVLDVIRGMAIKVESENISGQDVTEEYTDIQARLGNLEAAEEELLALLAEAREMRWKAEDILAVHRDLTSIRQQIESLKGRSQYLERMTALATISVSIRPKEAPKALVETEWDPLVTLSKAARSFRNVLLVFIDIGIYLVIFSPFVIVPVVIIWLLVRRARRKKRGGAAPAPRSQ